MKNFRTLFLAMVLVIMSFSTVFAELSPEEHNIKTVLNLEFGKMYYSDNPFDLIGAETERTNKGNIISCNNGKIKIFSHALINYILIEDSLVSLYGMEIGKTKWNDEIVENEFFIRRDFSPNGRTITVYYQSDTDKSIYYKVYFEASSYKVNPIFVRFEKHYIH